MNKYHELKKKFQEEINTFPMVFAFSNKQFEEAMEKLGLTVNDTDKIYRTPGGGFIKKTDSKALADLFKNHNQRMDEAIKADTTGEEFIYDMFQYELDNHEYNYTCDATDALESLGLTIAEIYSSPTLLKGFKLAGGKVFGYGY